MIALMGEGNQCEIGAYGATAALTYIYNSRINHPLYCYSLVDCPTESRFVGGLGGQVGAARERRCTHGPGVALVLARGLQSTRHGAVGCTWMR